MSVILSNRLDDRLDLLEMRRKITNLYARTAIRDNANSFFPFLTRNLRSRRDNRLATIAIVRSEVERHELELADSVTRQSAPARYLRIGPSHVTGSARRAWRLLGLSPWQQGFVRG